MEKGKEKLKFKELLKILEEFIEKQINMMIIIILLMEEIVFLKLIKMQHLCI